MKTKFKTLSFLIALAFVAITGLNAKTATELSITTDSDPVLEIETWMVQDGYWTSKSEIEVTPEVDEALEIESWMVNDCYWK